MRHVFFLVDMQSGETFIRFSGGSVLGVSEVVRAYTFECCKIIQITRGKKLTYIP